MCQFENLKIGNPSIATFSNYQIFKLPNYSAIIAFTTPTISSVLGLLK